jgi:acetolactate synthase I/II/III large subunit
MSENPAKPAAISGAEIFVRCLQEEGVEVVFGYPGGAVLHIYDALYRQDKIAHILVRHEQGAVHAAEGYAKSSDRCGVALVTSGPGRPTPSPASPMPTWIRCRWWCSPGRFRPT